MSGALAMPSGGRPLPVSTAPVAIVEAIAVWRITAIVSETPVITTAGRITSIPVPPGRSRARSATVPICGRSTIMWVIRSWGGPTVVPIGRQRVALIRLRYWRSSCRSCAITSCKCLHDSSDLVWGQPLLDKLLNKNHLQSGRISAPGWHVGGRARESTEQISRAILSTEVGQRRSLRLRGDKWQSRRGYRRSDRL